MTNRAWPLFDPDKHRWDEFKACTVLKALRMGADERDNSANLADVLPGEAVIYLENRRIAGRSLNTVFRHLDGIYGTTLTSNPVMAQTQLDKLVRAPKEPACQKGNDAGYSCGRTWLGYRSKGTKGLCQGINWEVTGPKLRKTLEKPDCTFAGLVKVAELTESRHLLKREDPIMTKYITDVSQGTAPIRAVDPEARDNPQNPRVEVSNYNPPPTTN
jgi:hypothetical protein